MTRKPTYEEMEQRIKELEEESAKRRRLEDTLRDNEARHTLILGNMTDSIWLMDLNFNVTWASSSIERNRGYSLEELSALPLEKLLAPASLRSVMKTISEELTPERLQQKDLEISKTMDLEFCRKDGSTYWNEVTMRLLRDQAGTPIGILGVGREIERRRMKEALRESEEKYRLLVESASEGILLTQEGKVRYLNPRALEFIGYSQEEIVARSMIHFAHPDDRERLVRLYLSKLAGEDVPPGTSWRIIDKSGTVKWVQSRSTLLTWEDKPSLLTFLIDITQQKKAEEELRESEEKYRLLVQNANDAIFIEQDETLKFSNPRAEELTGYPAGELSKIPFVNIIHPEDREMALERHRRRLSGEDVPSTYSFRIINKAGRELWLQLNAVLITWEGRQATLNFARDTTEQRKLEAQFQAAQRLESLGTLAGGIAHDFNNLLMGIQGRASLMLMDTDSTSPHFEHLKGIEEYVKSAADLTKQLLGFARGGKYEVKPSDLNEILEKSSSLFARTKKEIRVHGRYQEEIWSVDVDQGQVQQVLMNLYVNAWQAMPGGGDLYLETENVMLDESDVNPFNLSPGKYVKMSVIDTGMGMDEKTKARLFEPFFTTKGMGRGTGLGLASTYGIIKNHGGFINVYSEKGEGTTFSIYLPASDKALTTAKESEETVLKGSETVLLVDDEGAIIEVGRQMLERLGYAVLTAQGGREALEVYKAKEGRIDLVLLDMVMPGMGGGEVFDHLKEVNPEVRVLLSSGYSINGQAKNILDRGCHGFIQKPFNMQELSTKLRAILEKK